MKINVPHVAKLANLPISDKERITFQKQLQETVDYVEELNRVNTKNVEPTSQVTGLENIVRDDVTKPSLNQKQALSNSYSTHNGFFKVNAILENE